MNNEINNQNEVNNSNVQLSNSTEQNNQVNSDYGKNLIVNRLKRRFVYKLSGFISIVGFLFLLGGAITGHIIDYLVMIVCFAIAIYLYIYSFRLHEEFKSELRKSELGNEIMNYRDIVLWIMVIIIFIFIIFQVIHMIKK